MTKRVASQLDKFKYQNQPLRFNLGVLVLICLCSFLIVIATFTQLNFKHLIVPLDAFSYINANFKDPAIRFHFIKYCRYIPQIPAIMFIVVLLGRRFSIISALIYIIIGLFFAPVFALGGGPQYILQYGFGYILGYIPAMFFSRSIIKDSLTYKNMGQASLVGVLTIHIIGVLYMLFIATIQRESLPVILGWISVQSGIKILYDIIFSFLAMICAKITKKILWVAMG